MHYDQVWNDCGDTNALVMKMNVGSPYTSFKSQQFPALYPELVLFQWGNLICDDFEKQNIKVCSTTGGSASSNGLLQYLETIAYDVADIKKGHKDTLLMTVANQQAQILILQCGIEELLWLQVENRLFKQTMRAAEQQSFFLHCSDSSPNINGPPGNNTPLSLCKLLVID